MEIHFGITAFWIDKKGKSKPAKDLQGDTGLKWTLICIYSINTLLEKQCTEEGRLVWEELVNICPS